MASTTPFVIARALGAPGKAGSSVRTYAGHPPGTFGNNGDFCVDSVNEVFLGPKASGAWPSSGISLTPNQPAWAAPANYAGVNSTLAEHVVDARALPAGTLLAYDVLEHLALMHIAAGSVNDVKYVRVCISTDSADSLLLMLPAEAYGVLEVRTRLIVKSAAPHALFTQVVLNNDAYYEQQLDDVSVNFLTTTVQMQTRIWVANSLDAVVPDAVYLRLNRLGL